MDFVSRLAYRLPKQLLFNFYFRLREAMGSLLSCLRSLVGLPASPSAPLRRARRKQNADGGGFEKERAAALVGLQATRCCWWCARQGGLGSLPLARSQLHCRVGPIGRLVRRLERSGQLATAPPAAQLGRRRQPGARLRCATNTAKR